jgi:hypothetical protein
MEITKNFLFESLKINEGVRTIVRDIVKVFKTEDEGEFYLPEDISDVDSVYSFKNYVLTVELKINSTYDVDNYKVDANYYMDDDLIEIIIDYNPNVKKRILYELIGDLNEVVRHELQHANQYYHKTHDLGGDEVEDPFEYYTQPHEIDAQVRGFKRLSKLTKQPFEVVVKNWFKKNKDIHKLSEDRVNDIIKILMDYEIKI